jgi:hypothetical protein
MASTAKAADSGSKQSDKASSAPVAAAQAGAQADTGLMAQAVALQGRMGNRALGKAIALHSLRLQSDAAGEAAADRFADDPGRGAPARPRGTAAPSTPLDSPLRDAVAGVLARPGRPLERSVRDRIEGATGADLSAVRIHADEPAALSAQQLGARAYTVGPHIVFDAGEYSPATASGQRLLAHELGHVLQQQHAQPVVQRDLRDLEPLVEVFDRNIRSLESFLRELEAIPDQNLLFAREVGNIRLALEDIRRERDSTRRVAGGAGVPFALLSVPPELEAQTALDREVRGLYVRPGSRSADRERIAARAAMLERGITLMDTLRVRVLNLVNGVPADAPPALRDVTLDVASYYLQTATLLEPDALAQLAFLEVFYEDPAVIQCYAVSRHAQRALPDLVRNVQAVRDAAVLTDTDPIRRSVARAEELRDLISAFVSAIGDPPRRQAAIRAVPTARNAMELSSRLEEATVLIALLALWTPMEFWREQLGAELYAGTSLIPFIEQDRDRWQREMTQLTEAFMAEADAAEHPDFESRVTAWEQRVQRLIDEIPPAIRTRRIMAAVVSQIPFLFVGGAIAGGVGRWVGLMTGGSRWLMAFAEGVTMTVLTALATPRSTHPTTAGGWALQLGLNIAWARIGRALFEAGADVVRGMGTARGALARVGVSVVAPTATIATLQTLVQQIEEHATHAGGETSFTEMLTVNLVMNALGVLSGAAMNMHAGPGGTRPSAAELARRASITEDAAQRWLDLAGRAEAYGEGMRALERLARRGELTPEEFEAMREQGLALADELGRVLPDLAQTLGLGQTPEQVRAGVAAFRARLQALTYTPRPAVTALLPEYTAGLQRVTAATFVYDPAAPPERLLALRAALVERGYTVRDRPNGGFEALDASGQIVAQIVPAARASLAALPASSLADAAAGPQAQAGLARVRAQSVDRTLEARLAEAAGRGRAAGRTVTRLLRILGRIDAADTGSWEGVSNFLRRGGDVEALTRLLSHPSARADAPEALLRAQTALRQIAGWDESAVRGLAVLYAERPRMTAERVANLFQDFEPEQVRGIFQSLDRLSSVSRGLGRVIGPLFSGDVAQQRGAMGSLTSAVQLAERYPGRIISFEEPVIDVEAGRVIRVQDILVIERETTRVAGVETTSEFTVAAFEIKEISTASLGRRGPHQLAVDILLDARARAERVTPVGASRPFFETFRWRIRRTELAERAARNLGISDVNDPRVEPEMRRIVEGMLERAFDDPVLGSLSAEERAGYERAFTGVPFVEFF